MKAYGLLTEVDFFCGCISLHYGAYIIAAIYFVLGICGFGLSVHQQQYICSLFEELHIDFPCASPFFISVIVASIVEITVSVLLAIGVKIKIRGLLTPWMVWNAFLVPLSMAFSVYVTTVAFSIRVGGPKSPPGFTAVILSLLTAVPTLYGVVVVYSVYRLQDESDTECMKSHGAEDTLKIKTKL